MKLLHLLTIFQRINDNGVEMEMKVQSLLFYSSELSS